MLPLSILWKTSTHVLVIKEPILPLTSLTSIYFLLLLLTDQSKRDIESFLDIFGVLCVGILELVGFFGCVRISFDGCWVSELFVL